MCEVMRIERANFYQENGRTYVEVIGKIYPITRASDGARYKFGKVTGIMPTQYANKTFHVSRNDYDKLDSADSGIVEFAMRVGPCDNCKAA